MKQYLLFAGDAYYPGGGWDDFIAHFDSIHLARAHAKTLDKDWWQIVDTETMKEVAR